MDKSLFQLGADLESVPSKTQKEEVFASDRSEPRADHFVDRDGHIFAGYHLIVDFWQASYLDDKEYIEKAFREAIESAGACLLFIHLHRFTPYGGLSGVAILAESHISIHTWPERGYAALDVFMCGQARPDKAVESLKRSLRPQSVTVTWVERGALRDGGA